ncbi:MAG: cytochrome P450 [Synechococcales bacterium]|nr:cytochrome P450 [Synechococcales bacterium]
MSQPAIPPGRLGLPVIGETFAFLNDADFAQIRHNRYGNIFKTRLFGKPTVFVRGAIANEFVLANENRYFQVTWPQSTRALLGSLSLALQRGGVHQSRRKLLAQAFLPRALDGYIPAMTAITQRHLARWEQMTPLTWYPELRNYTFDVASALLVGLENGSQTSLGHWFEAWSQGLFSLPINLPWTSFGRAMRSRQKLLSEIETLIRQRQANPDASTDSLGLLLQAADEDGQRLTIEELKDQILLLLFAGHETLTSAIASFCLLTAQHPAILHQLRQEQATLELPDTLTLDHLKRMGYLDQVLREVLRLIPPVGGGFRDVIQTCELQGYQIPQGWSLLYGIGQTHQDVTLYPDPDQFDPERFNPKEADASATPRLAQKYGYVPFGGGIRECLGKEFARLEMKLFAVYLLRGYDWKLLPDQDLSMVTVPTPHPRDGLRVQFNSV